MGSLGVLLGLRRRAEPSTPCVPFTLFLPTTEYSVAKWYSRVFKFSLCLMMLDFFLNVIWLPIGASKTYGLRTAHEAFWDTCMWSSSFLLDTLGLSIRQWYRGTSSMELVFVLVSLTATCHSSWILRRSPLVSSPLVS